MDIDVKSLKIGLTNQPCFVVFDILYLNGQTLTNKPLTERFKILEEIIQPLEGVIVISAKNTVTTGYVLIFTFIATAYCKGENYARTKEKFVILEKYFLTTRTSYLTFIIFASLNRLYNQDRADIIE